MAGLLVSSQWLAREFYGLNGPAAGPFETLQPAAWRPAGWTGLAGRLLAGLGWRLAGWGNGCPEGSMVLRARLLAL